MTKLIQQLSFSSSIYGGAAVEQSPEPDMVKPTKSFDEAQVSAGGSKRSAVSASDAECFSLCLGAGPLCLNMELSKYRKALNVVHINAQSIPSHHSDMLASLDNNNIHAILVSESWLKPSLDSSVYPLPGFKLVRNDRTNKGGGGVAIYLRSHIPYTIVSRSPSEYSGKAEHLFLEVRTPKPKKRTILQRNFKRMDLQRLCEDANAIDWAQLNSIDDIDARVELFNSLLTDLFDKHAPLRPVRVKQLPAPWLTDNIKTLMSKRDHAKYCYKKQPTDEHLQKYKELRNRCNRSGFRTGHSTVTALIKVTDDIRFNMDNHQVTILTLLDFSNAFNTVNFDILLGILQSLNVSPTVTSWFESYLKGRQQCVRTDAESSAWCPVLAGVPQGGVLSPLLFSLFINVLAKQLTSLYHLYADDLQIYTSVLPENINMAINDINSNLEIISKWVKKFGLLLNPDKSQAIILGSSRLLNKTNLFIHGKLTYDGTEIHFVNAVKNLGVIMDSTLSWLPQVEAVSKKMFASFHSLKRMQFFLPHHTKITLAQSLLLPILDYADSIVLNLSGSQFAFEGILIF
ncbi:unnamed protein product [Plutella xylostella]|uniref:(diamondback moth) hypothetical protein n=1 Tax=Plutella xylostella TaxID=51655 RepID=A0A8S4G1F1_PLUXY|nr:unnamed protein product [Plutella xylostella]